LTWYQSKIKKVVLGLANAISRWFRSYFRVSPTFLDMCHHHDIPKPPTDIGKPWRPDDGAVPFPLKPGSSDIYRADVLETITNRIQELSEELRGLSLDIHG